MKLQHLMDLAFANGKATPRVHGNGFIQLDLNEFVRLHVWGHPDIPKQATPTPIHDHIFGFASLVLKGQMTNNLYEVVDDDADEDVATHEVYTARVRHGEDTVLRPLAQTQFVVLRWVIAQIVNEGEMYMMTPDRIHESIVHGPTATLMLKSGPSIAQGAGSSPAVFVPIHTTPDNTFNRYAADPGDLWRIIFEVLG